MKTHDTLIKEKILDDERIALILEKIPERYKSVDIEQVDEKIRSWLFGEHKDGKGLYLYGPVGTGKTHAAYAMYRILMENRIHSRIVNSAAMLQDIKDDFKYGARDPYYQSKFDSWVDMKGVLIIDDLGAEKITDWTLETFYTLINTRYEHKRFTIFTSNYNVEEIAGRLGDRIASRIVEMCDVMKLDGKDKRV